MLGYLSPWGQQWYDEVVLIYEGMKPNADLQILSHLKWNKVKDWLKD